MSEAEVRQMQQKLVDSLKKNGFLHSAAVEEAFLAVPRHLFLPDEPVERAYEDVAIVVKRDPEGHWNSSSSQPAIMAIMLEQLELRPGHRVLEIGAGTGFNAALMAHLVGPEGQVVTVDIQPDLVEAARDHLDAAGFPQVQAVAADGGFGWPEAAPYDRIILTVSSHAIPQAWVEQLVPAGRLVIPFGMDRQVAVAFIKQGDNLESVSIHDCGFMNLQGAFAAPQPVFLRFGPEEKINIYSRWELPASIDQIETWLNGGRVDLASGVQVQVGEALSWLGWWLTANRLQTADLAALGDLAEAGVIPELFGIAGEFKAMHTFVRVEADGIAALMRPPGERAPLMDFNRPSDEREEAPIPFELYVRQMGPGASAAERLLRAVREWDSAGRPSTRHMRLTVYPPNRDLRLAPGETLLDSPYSQVVMRYER